jgi:N-acetyl-anhydromuramyl-L-alanine amidase AmpD
MRPIEKLILHCSASPNDLDIGVLEIRAWHREKGYADIGYHEVIRRDGHLEIGRPIERIGAHAKGHNLYSIGICLVGLDAFTPDQMSTLLERCRYYMARFGLKPDQVFGHYELDLYGKTCPNFDVEPLRQDLGA